MKLPGEWCDVNPHEDILTALDSPSFSDIYAPVSAFPSLFTHLRSCMLVKLTFLISLSEPEKVPDLTAGGK